MKRLAAAPLLALLAPPCFDGLLRRATEIIGD
jgi:hypothetical protein